MPSRKATAFSPRGPAGLRGLLVVGLLRGAAGRPLEMPPRSGQTCEEAARRAQLDVLLHNSTVRLGTKNPCWRTPKGDVCLPYAYLLAPQKSGTTETYHRVALHARVLDVEPKEPMFWSWKVFKENSERMNVFQYHKRNSRALHLPQSIVFDGSADTIYEHVGDCTSAAFIKKYQPDAKFVAVLRDPVERTHSDYWFFSPPRFQSQAPCFDPRPSYFHAAMQKELRGIDDCLANSTSAEHCAYSKRFNQIGQQMCPLNRKTAGRPLLSVYELYLRSYFRHFPRENIFVARLEDFDADRKGFMKRLFEFLELPPIPESDTAMWRRIADPHHMRTGKAFDSAKPKHPKLQESTREMLRDWFSPHNRRLEELVGWKEQGGTSPMWGY